jgi:hypothetical protein
MPLKSWVQAWGALGAAVIIPFRDRGDDPLRALNLRRVLDHWQDTEMRILVVDDGRWRQWVQFNRSAAYNNGAATTTAEILVFAEADMIVPHNQIVRAVGLAAEKPGLVVPFTRQVKLNREESELVRLREKNPWEFTPKIVVGNNYGCVNVLSRETLKAVGGWDQAFEGNAHDDAAMWRAFEVVAGPTRFVDGPAYHLYHQEAIRPDATEAAKAAAERNYRRMQMYMQAKTPEEIRHLTSGGGSLIRNWRGHLT